MSYNDHEIETLNDTKDSAVHVMRNVKHSRGNAVSVDWFQWGGFECGWEGGLLLGHTRAVDAGGAHLCEDLVQPLKGTIKM